MRVEEVAQELGISKSHAYKVIQSTESFSWRSFATARRERRANHGSL